MPFKAHSKGRRHIPRQRHRVTNWREYDASLRNRRSLTVWFTREAIAGWKAQPRTTPGGQRHYSDLAIETALTSRAVLRQSVFGRLAGYEDVNDAERLRHDLAMRWIVGGRAVMFSAASPSQVGRFETRWLAADKNLWRSLIFLAGGSTACTRRPPKGVILDMVRASV